MEENSTSTPYLPKVMIMEILCRLPVKKLIQLCIVCKFWRDLITSDQIFIRYHFQRSLSSTHNSNGPRSKQIIFYGPSSSKNHKCGGISHHQLRNFLNPNTRFNEPFFLGTDNFFLVGCSNGVFCFFQQCFHLNRFDMFLWNPALHQFNMLPDPNSSRSCHRIVVGFGFDHVNNDVKIVKIYACLPISAEIYKIEVYSLISKSWKAITLTNVPFWIVHFYSISNLVGVVLHGFLHWIAKEMRGKCLYLVTFDLATENLGKISYPGNVVADPLLGLLDGCLCLSGYTGNTKNHRFDSYEIWMMKEYGVENSWSKQFVISSTDLCSQPRPLNPLFSTAMATDGGRKIFAVENGIVVLQELESRIVEPLQQCLVSYGICFYFLVDNYVESLVSIRPSDCDEKHEALIVLNEEEKKEERKSGNSLKELFGCFWK